MRITQKEREATKRFKEAAEALPDSLWLFAASGILYVMKRNADGEMATVSFGGGFDPDYIVENIKVAADGGDW